MKKELTRDHVTPRCIGKALGWKNKAPGKNESMHYRITHPSINDPVNIQLLPWFAHERKDRITPSELEHVLRGGGKPFDAHHNEYKILSQGLWHLVKKGDEAA